MSKVWVCRGKKEEKKREKFKVESVCFPRVLVMVSLVSLHKGIRLLRRVEIREGHCTSECHGKGKIAEKRENVPRYWFSSLCITLLKTLLSEGDGKVKERAEKIEKSKVEGVCDSILLLAEITSLSLHKFMGLL